MHIDIELIGSLSSLSDLEAFKMFIFLFHVFILAIVTLAVASPTTQAYDDLDTNNIVAEYPIDPLLLDESNDSVVADCALDSSNESQTGDVFRRDTNRCPAVRSFLTSPAPSSGKVQQLNIQNGDVTRPPKVDSSKSCPDVQKPILLHCDGPEVMNSLGTQFTGLVFGCAPGESCYILENPETEKTTGIEQGLSIYCCQLYSPHVSGTKPLIAFGWFFNLLYSPPCTLQMAVKE